MNKFQKTSYTRCVCVYIYICHHDKFLELLYKTIQKKKLLICFIKFLFIHQLMYQSVVLKNNIKIYIKTAPTCFGVTVTPSSGSALICAY